MDEIRKDLNQPETAKATAKPATKPVAKASVARTGARTAAKPSTRPAVRSGIRSGASVLGRTVNDRLRQGLDAAHPATRSSRADTGEIPARPIFENPSFKDPAEDEIPAAARTETVREEKASRANGERPSGSMNTPAGSGAPQGERPGAGAGMSGGPGATPSGSQPGGSYTDPRTSFRYGESASWTNGETTRRQKFFDARGRKAKKVRQPVTMSRGMLGLLIAGCLFLSCLFGLGGAVLGHSMLTQNSGTAQTTSTAPASASESAETDTVGYSLENATGANMTVKEITAAAQNSVVEIRTESVASDSWMPEYVMEGAGSGVIISKDGYIMTNNHVISGANKIKVTTADGTEYQAELVGTDENNDVAVIKVEANDLTPAVYGNSDQLEVGDLAVAIGNPLGELGGTVTAGIISATDRELSIEGKTLHLLQTDSSINPGNSGGGLFNGDGQLIGLVVAKSSGSGIEGLGFAIPINKAASCASQLIDKGYVSGQPSTGMTYQEAASSSGGFESLFGGGSSSTQVYIYSVNGKNAKAAGFEPGDRVVSVDDKEITSFEALSSVITAHEVGDTVTFVIDRNGTEKTIKLELEEKQAENTGGQDSGSQKGEDQNGDSQDNGQQTPDGEQQIPDDGDQQMPDDGSQQDPFGEDPFGSDQQPDNGGGGSLFDYFFGN